MLAAINLTHLRYFYDAVLLGSITAAAREHFVSQSAISQGIAKLELALQVLLTTHQRQSFRLTEEGEVVFEEAKAIFASVDGLKERISGLKNEISGSVHFSCTNALAQFFLPAGYLRMKNEYPLVQLKFHRGSLHFVHESLQQEKVKFALALDAPEFYGYERQLLYKGHFRLYKAKGTKKSLAILVDHAANAEVLSLRKMYHARYSKELAIQEELSGWAMVATFVQMGCGTGYLPDFIFRENSKVQEVKLDLPLIEYTISAFWLKGAKLSRASNAFLQLLKIKFV
jgi:DNA-binding transcriptional LysR family regulator